MAVTRPDFLPDRGVPAGRRPGRPAGAGTHTVTGYGSVQAPVHARPPVRGAIDTPEPPSSVLSPGGGEHRRGRARPSHAPRAFRAQTGRSAPTGERRVRRPGRHGPHGGLARAHSRGSAPRPPHAHGGRPHRGSRRGTAPNRPELDRRTTRLSGGSPPRPAAPGASGRAHGRPHRLPGEGRSGPPDPIGSRPRAVRVDPSVDRRERPDRPHADERRVALPGRHSNGLPPHRRGPRRSASTLLLRPGSVPGGGYRRHHDDRRPVRGRGR